MKITITDDPNWGTVRYHVKLEHHGVKTSGIAKDLTEALDLAKQLTSYTKIPARY